jgi:hypothetical protein
MNCFYHSQNPAIGLCKNCSKGLCTECAVDQGYGLACKSRCEGEVQSIWQIIQRSKSAYQKTAGAYLRNALFSAFMGLLFFIFPYFFLNAPQELNYLFFGFATILLLGTIFNLINAYRIKKI